MLEFFAVFSLCRVNRRNAIARGHKPGGFIALTIILWIVFEIIGFIIGALIFNSSYTALLLVGLPCAAIGGLISFLIAKNLPQGNYVDPSTIATPVVTVGPNGAPVYQDPNTPAYMLHQVPVQPVQPMQPVQPAGAAGSTHYCRYCGAPNNSSSRFCESCGQNIG